MVRQRRDKRGRRRRTRRKEGEEGAVVLEGVEEGKRWRMKCKRGDALDSWLMGSGDDDESLGPWCLVT